MSRTLRRSRNPNAYPIELRAEQRFGRRARAEGWYYLKLSIGARRGWPDRMILAPGGLVIFIEWKRRGAAPRPQQRKIHRELAALGFLLIVGYDEEVVFDEVVALVRAVGDRP